MNKIICSYDCTSENVKYIACGFSAEGKEKREKLLWFHCQIQTNLVVSLETTAATLLNNLSEQSHYKEYKRGDHMTRDCCY